MIEASIFDEKARQIYESHREEWEKLYNGKIIAIDIDTNDLVSVGNLSVMSILKPGEGDRVTGYSCAG